MNYSLSLLTSSTQRCLADIPFMFLDDSGQQMPRPDAVELYLFRDCDLWDLDLDGCNDTSRRLVSLVSRMQCQMVADQVEARLDALPVSALATYFPELSSGSAELRAEAVEAVVAAVKLAELLKAPRVEIVGGRHDEEADENTWVPGEGGRLTKEDSSVVVSYKNFLAPTQPDAVDLGPKVKWLIEDIENVHARLQSDCPDHCVQLALEMEPGMLFVLSRRHVLKHVLRNTRHLRLANGDPFVGVNCDIGHMQVMTYTSGLHPSVVWREILPEQDEDGGSPAPVRMLGNFHASIHPYQRLHMDHPPTTHPWYAVPGMDETYDRYDWSVPRSFFPWLGCIHCVSGRVLNGPANVSLELEAAARDEPSLCGLDSLRKAMDSIAELRKKDSYWQMLGCADCPLNPKKTRHRRKKGLGNRLT